MAQLHRFRFLFTLLLGSGFFLLSSRADAITEKEIRELARHAEEFEKEANWEKAREIYEALLNQRDFGLRIRERYQKSLRRCWQIRRHQDPSYRKEVLSIEYGQAIRVYNVITTTLLDGAVDKQKLDASKLFRKGLSELDAALNDRFFVEQHVPEGKRNDIAAFRELLKKTWGDVGSLSRKETAKQLGEVAMAAEVHLQLNATVAVMEFACGACYAIDNYTVYLTPSQLRELAESLSRSEAVGVGLKLAIQDNKIVVRDAMGTMAAADMIRPGDEVISVDKKAVVDLQLSAVVGLLEGPMGSTVEVEFMSPKAMMVYKVQLERRATVVPSVDFSFYSDTSIGYLKISGFTDSTLREVDEALAMLTSQYDMKALIIDLRENNGGVFESAIETARRFLSTGIIASTQHQDSKFNFVYNAKNPNALTMPIAVLVDGDTASAAEVLAGALKDNNRATLIGQTTFGKGCTQCVLKLPNALGGVPTGGLKLTVARFFSPKGVSYSGRGIVPHILIEGMDQSASLDTIYRERAIQELTRLLAMPK